MNAELGCLAGKDRMRPRRTFPLAETARAGIVIVSRPPRSSSMRWIPVRLAAVITALSCFAPPAPRAAEPAKEDARKGKPNRLAKESSPYLLQHAHNPVDWYP